MRTAVAVFVIAVCPADLAFGQTTGGTTMWSFLGVPNPFGLNQAAQQSQNPAVAAAAQAKAAKHEICKKKAAIQYLANIGCVPEHPEVMPALLAAMDDPDEQIRYEAVKAVLKTTAACQSPEQKKEFRKAKPHSESLADMKKACEKAVCDCIDRLCGKAPPKQHDHKLKKKMKSMLGQEECPNPAEEDCPCAERRGNCCSEDMRAKLTKLAYGRDDQGCFLEPSKRVRDLAAQAVQACNSCACGCGPGGGGGGIDDNTVREMPPVDARETPPGTASPAGDCECMRGFDMGEHPRPLPVVEDRLGVPTMPAPGPTPADVEELPMPPLPSDDMQLPPSVLVRPRAAPGLWTPTPPQAVFAEEESPTEFIVGVSRSLTRPQMRAFASPPNVAITRPVDSRLPGNQTRQGANSAATNAVAGAAGQPSRPSVSPLPRQSPPIRIASRPDSGVKLPILPTRPVPRQQAPAVQAAPRSPASRPRPAGQVRAPVDTATLGAGALILTIMALTGGWLGFASDRPRPDTHKERGPRPLGRAR